MVETTEAIFLDRDGVINEKPPSDTYVTSWEEFNVLPGVIDAIRRINQSHYRAIVVTNQRGVARGRCNGQDIRNIHEKLEQKLQEEGAYLDDIFFCPHGKDRCSCRKPGTGMLEEAQAQFHLDADRCWLIGDSLSDMQAGNRFGARTIYITSCNRSEENWREDIRKH